MNNKLFSNPVHPTAVIANSEYRSDLNIKYMSFRFNATNKLRY